MKLKKNIRNLQQEIGLSLMIEIGQIVLFKSCAPFIRDVTHINDEYIDTADNLDITMPMYNLIEYTDNYSDTSGSL